MTIHDDIDIDIYIWCYPAVSELQCMTWHGEQQLQEGQQIATHHGIAFLLILQELSAMSYDAWDQNDTDALHLMQNQATRWNRRAARPVETSSLNPSAPAFDPHRIPIEVMNEFVQDLHQQWERCAFQWEDEEKSSLVDVWFVDHANGHLHCTQPRRVRLYEDFRHWEDMLLSPWRDQRIPQLEIEYNLVTPNPEGMHYEVSAHVIIVQAPHPQLVTTLLTVHDCERNRRRFRLQNAITTHEHIWIEHLAQGLGIHGPCFQSPFTHVCEVWYGQYQLRNDHPFQARSGQSLALDVRPRTARNRGPVLLQLQSHIVASPERQTRGQVAHTHGPGSNIEHDSHEHDTTAVKLLDLAGNSDLPSYVEVPPPGTAEQVAHELRAWGHSTRVFECWPQPLFACCPQNVEDQVTQHYLICRSEVGSEQEVFVHTAQGPMKPPAILSFLCQLQYPRAVIIAKEQLCHGWTKIVFSHQEPQGYLRAPSKCPGVWPPPYCSHKATGRPFFHSDQIQELHGTCVLRTTLQANDLQELFQSGDNMLCRNFTCFDLPEMLHDALEPYNTTDETIDLAKYDRILIFTDGTSAPEVKRIPPTRADELGKPDAWAFLVVGENICQGQHIFTPIGWSAQVVRYDDCGSHFNGISKIGADMAERSALTWAAMWRISQNVDVETIFCIDSAVTGAQGFGEMGTCYADESFRLQRGVIQALESALPPGCISWHHVKSHTGLIYNEFVDIVAKRESSQSFNLPRQRISMQRWRHIVPHLWMTFAGSRWGLPPWRDGGFEVPPPALPHTTKAEQEFSAHDFKHKTVKFTISIATANVHSLSRHPDGHAGKLHYLQQQMRLFKLNCIGVQEARTERGVACRDNILRLSSGHQHGHLGVELWLDLDMPIGHDNTDKPLKLHRSDVQVVHTDARRLLARIDDPAFSAWICVLHAPHSGYKLQERADWWEDTQNMFAQHSDGAPLFVLMDANAPPGAADGHIVMKHGFSTTTSTKYMRELLQAHDLCLPTTGSCHVGDHGTWLDLHGEKWHDIDHIAIPSSWLHRCVHSQVLEDFDMATAHEDHRALAIQLQWQDVVLVARARPHQRRLDCIDYTSADLATRIKDYQPLPWEDDIERHTEGFNEHVRKALQASAVRRADLDGAKKHYIDETTWKCRKNKLRHRATLKALRKKILVEIMQRCFNSWKKADKQVDSAESRYLTSLYCWNLKHWIAFRRASQLLKKGLCNAKQAKLQQVLQEMKSDTAASEIIRQLKQFIGPTNPKKIKCKTLPMISNNEGEICTYPAEALNAWIEFFMQMEGGQRISHSSLREKWIKDLEAFAQEHLQLDIQELPTLTDLELSYRRVPGGRARGPDNIPGELCHHQPAILAKASFSQLAKLICHGQEFLGHKGGQLTPAYKGKGSPAICSSYRSLLVSSNIGKVLHRTIRQANADLYEMFLQTQQVGGRRKVPVQLALHQVRAHMRRAAHRHRSAGVLFLDLTEAFYRIMRELAVGGVPTDALLAHMMKRLDLPSTALHDIRDLLLEGSALQQAGLSSTARNCIQAIHTGTFFWLPGQHDVALTQMGTRPGDSFADIIFGYAWCLVLKKLEGYMIQHQLTDPMESANAPGFFGSEHQTAGDVATSHVFIGPTWMDDLALCVDAGSPSELEHRIGQSTSYLLELCDKHMMTPNLAKGKTEMLMVFRGHGSRSLKTKHYGMSAPGTFPIACERGMRSIQIVKSYKHLGGWLHHKPDQRTEMKQKGALAHETFSRHRKVLFANKHIELRKRAELFTTLVLTKMLYGADSWTLHTQNDKARLHAIVIRLYKRLIKWSPDMCMSDEAIIVAAGLPSPTELLRRARLRYLLVLINCGMSHIWSLLKEDVEWCRLLEDDLVWMWKQLQWSSCLKDPRQHWPQWMMILQDHRSYWKRLVNRACHHAILQRQKNFEVCALHRRIFERAASCFGLHPLPAQDGESQENMDEEMHFGCMTCKISCRSRAGEGAHMFKTHHIAASCRQWFDEPSCPACLKFFHTMNKMKAHLYYSASCRQHLLSSNMNCERAPGTGSTEDRRREVVHDFLLPPVQGHGPQLPRARNREQVCIDDGLHLFLVEMIDRRTLLTDMQNDLEGFLEMHPISWTLWRATFLFFVQNFEEGDANFFEYDFEELKRRLLSFADASTWSFLQKNVDRREQGQLRNIDECHDGCQWFYSQLAESDIQIPRQFGRHRYVLHAFSGRRRLGDLQYFLEQAMGMDKPYILHVISLDVVVDATWGNVADKDTRRFWLEAIRSRWVAAFLSGPPCETWSRVRAVVIDQGANTAGKTGPRVIRDLNSLWGYDCISLKELYQILVGNTLLGFSLEAMLEIAAVGGLGLLEHPAEPEDFPTAASIWRLPLMQWLLMLPGAQRIRFSQGLMGAPTPKPTDLLTINMNHVLFHLHQCRVRVELPWEKAVGRNLLGQWKTAILKEYPPSVRMAFANAFIQGLDSLQIDPNVQQPSEAFIARCRTMECTEYGQTLGNDFAG